MFTPAPGQAQMVSMLFSSAAACSSGVWPQAGPPPMAQVPRLRRDTGLSSVPILIVFIARSSIYELLPQPVDADASPCRAAYFSNQPWALPLLPKSMILFSARAWTASRTLMFRPWYFSSGGQAWIASMAASHSSV